MSAVFLSGFFDSQYLQNLSLEVIGALIGVAGGALLALEIEKWLERQREKKELERHQDEVKQAAEEAENQARQVMTAFHEAVNENLRILESIKKDVRREPVAPSYNVDLNLLDAYSATPYKTRELIPAERLIHRFRYELAQIHRLIETNHRVDDDFLARIDTASGVGVETMSELNNVLARKILLGVSDELIRKIASLLP